MSFKCHVLKDKLLAIYKEDTFTIRICNIDKCRLVQYLHCPDKIKSVLSSPDATTLIVTFRHIDTIQIWQQVDHVSVSSSLFSFCSSINNISNGGDHFFHLAHTLPCTNGKCALLSDAQLLTYHEYAEENKSSLSIWNINTKKEPTKTITISNRISYDIVVLASDLIAYTNNAAHTIHLMNLSTEHTTHQQESTKWYALLKLTTNLLAYKIDEEYFIYKVDERKSLDCSFLFEQGRIEKFSNVSNTTSLVAALICHECKDRPRKYSIRLFNVSTLRPSPSHNIFQLDGEANYFSELHISQHLLMNSRGSSILIWNIESGLLILNMEHSTWVENAMLSSNEEFFAVLDNTGHIDVWSREIGVLQGKGEFVFVQKKEQRIHLPEFMSNSSHYEVKKSTRRRIVRESPCVLTLRYAQYIDVFKDTLVFKRNFASMCAVNYDDIQQQHQVEGKEGKNLHITCNIGDLVRIVSENVLLVYDTETSSFRLIQHTVEKEPIEISLRLNVPKRDIRYMLVLADATRLLVGYDEKKSSLWSLVTCELIAEHMDCDARNAIEMSSQVLASVCDTNKIELWDLNTGKRQHKTIGHTTTNHEDYVEIRCLARISDNELASAKMHKESKNNGLLTILSSTDSVCELIREWKIPMRSVVLIAYIDSPRKTLATTEESLIHIWSAERAGLLLRTLSGHAESIRHLKVLESTHVLLSADFTEIKYWDLAPMLGSLVHVVDMQSERGRDGDVINSLCFTHTDTDSDSNEQQELLVIGSDTYAPKFRPKVELFKQEEGGRLG